MIVLERQNIIDISLIGSGVAESAFEIAYANSISVSDKLTVGQDYTISNVIDTKTVNFFKNRKIKPATSDIESNRRAFDFTFDITFQLPLIPVPTI